MKQILLMIALVVFCVGCGTTSEPTKTNPEKLIADPIVEKAIRKQLKKPTGKLTKADLKARRASLDLRDNNLTELPKGLEKLPRLKVLFLDDNKLTSVKGLEKLTQLTSLSLIGNQLTDVKELEKHTQLTHLHLSGNQLTDVKGLEKLVQLTGLYLSSNKLTDVKGLERLSHPNKLQDLDAPPIPPAKRYCR